MLRPSNVADPFAWSTLMKDPEAETCRPLSDTEYVPFRDAELQVPPPIWTCATRGAASRLKKRNRTAVCDGVNALTSPTKHILPKSHGCLFDQVFGFGFIAGVNLRLSDIESITASVLRRDPVRTPGFRQCR